MLEVGVTNTQSAEPPLSFTEARAHFGAWAITSSPLVIGMNVTDDATVDAFWDILSNTEAIAVNQEYAGEAANLFWESDALTAFSPCGWWLANCTYASQMYWSKRLPNGDVAVLMLNNADTPAALSLEFDRVPGLLPPQGTVVQVRDLWAHANLGRMAGAFVPVAPTPSRDSIFLRLTPIPS
jgi:alpha-galactosidase